MKLLAIESSFEACSVALWLDGEVRERFHAGPRGHAEHLLPFVDELLGEASLALGELDAIGFSRGPGSFTSLRLGIGMVQGLAWGADLPVVPVSSLQVVAQAALGKGAPRAWVAMDARMDEVFTGRFEREGDFMVPVSEETVCPASHAIPSETGDWWGIGNGFERYEALIDLPLMQKAPGLTARAEFLAALAVKGFEAGEMLPAEQAQPVYLRNQVAKKSAERKQ